MQFSLSILALAASILSVSAELSHSHFHKRAHAKPLEKRAMVTANSKIQTLAADPSFTDAVEGRVAGMPFHNTLINNSTQSAKVYFWTGMHFAVPATVYNTNPAAPALIVDLPAGTSKVVSFTNNYSGAYAAIFPQTDIQAGGGFKTAWVEITTSGITPVVDVSMLPDMSSKWVAVETDGCISDVTSCSYQCNDGSSSCWTAPTCQLMNCPSGPHTIYDAGPNGAGPWNGGCRVSPTFTTTFSSPS